MSGKTQRKRSKAALLDTEAMYRELLEHQGEGFALLDAHEHFQVLNPVAEEIFGVSPGSLQGRSLLEFLTQDQQELVQRESRLRAKGTHSTYELQIKREDGLLRTLLVTATPRFGTKGENLQVIGVFRDITEDKRAEDELRKSQSSMQAILASTADGILAIDLERKILHFNKRFAEIWHIPQELAESGDDKALLEFVLTMLVDPIAFIAKVEALYASDQEDQDTVLFADGRIIERYSRPMMLDGSITGRVWSFRDITDRKNLEVERESLIASLQEALDQVKTLSGLLPICSSCKKIRDEAGYWNQVEHYLSSHGDLQFTHGICPDCAKVYFPKKNNLA
jgi:PAS domain S-box-containing protein